MQCSALLDAARLGREIDDEMMTRWASDTLHARSHILRPHLRIPLQQAREREERQRRSFARRVVVLSKLCRVEII